MAKTSSSRRSGSGTEFGTYPNRKLDCSSFTIIQVQQIGIIALVLGRHNLKP